MIPQVLRRTGANRPVIRLIIRYTLRTTARQPTFTMPQTHRRKRHNSLLRRPIRRARYSHHHTPPTNTTKSHPALANPTVATPYRSTGWLQHSDQPKPTCQAPRNKTDQKLVLQTEPTHDHDTPARSNSRLDCGSRCPTWTVAAPLNGIALVTAREPEQPRAIRCQIYDQ
jgi:hypothetical protein